MTSKPNKGTGAGGSNTTRNGSEFEKRTSILNLYPYEEHEFTYKGSKTIGKYFDITINDLKFTWTTQHALSKWFEQEYPEKYTKQVKKFCPDQAIYDKDNEILFILEAKTQGSGSVDEKIQTGHVKLIQYGDMYNVSIYLLNDQFRKPKYYYDIETMKRLTTDVHYTFYEDKLWKETFETIIASYYK